MNVIKKILIWIDIIFTGYITAGIEKVLYKKNIDFSIPRKRDESYKSDYTHYQASIIGLQKGLKKLKPGEGNASIIDIGCGKGKMVYFFYKHGFDKSDGIEFQKELAFCGQENMRKLGVNCQIFNEDATLFDGYKNYCYFYFYNPFGHETMKKVIDKIKDSIIEKPRKVYLIYHHPLCHEVIINDDFWVCVKTYTNFYRKITGRETKVYTNVRS